MQIPSSRTLTACLLALALIQAGAIAYLASHCDRGTPADEISPRNLREVPRAARDASEGAAAQELEPGQGSWCGTPVVSRPGAGWHPWGHADSGGLSEVGYDTLETPTGRTIRLRWKFDSLPPAAR